MQNKHPVVYEILWYISAVITGAALALLIEFIILLST